MDDTIFRVCELIREREDPPTPCERCPEFIDTPYGRGTQGCRLLALEVMQLARAPIDKIVANYETRLQDAMADTARAQTANAELRECVMRLKGRVAELVTQLRAKHS